MLSERWQISCKRVNMHVNTQKHHGNGMDLFACVFSHVDGCVVSFVFQTLKIVKINTINKIKPINNEKIFIFAL